MKGNRAFGFVFLILLVSVMAFGEMIVLPTTTTESFNVENVLITINDVIIPSCTPSEYSVLITNNNKVPIRVNVDQGTMLSSVKPEWVTFTNKIVTIPAQSSQKITLFINPACKTSGKFGLRLIYEINGINVETRSKVEITHTNNIDLAIFKDFAQACPCEPLEYEFEVKNSGQFTDTYTVNIKDAVVQPYTFPLQSGATQKVKAIVQYSCNRFGNFSLPVSVTSEANGYIARTKVSGTIDQCYNFTIEGPSTIEACALGEKVVANYIVKNNQKFANSYYIALKAKQAELSGTYFELEGEQNGTFEITVDPRKEQNITADLKISTGIGKTSANKEISVLVNSCYGLSLEVPIEDANKRKIEICSGDTDYKFYVSNNGIFNEEVIYDLQTSKGINATILGTEYLIVGEKEETKLFFNEFPEQNFNAQISVILKNNSQVRDTINLKFEKLSDKKCFGVTITPTIITLKENETSANITITSKGIRTGTYNISHSEEYETNISEITLSPGESQTITYGKINETSSIMFAPIFLTTQETTFRKTIVFLSGFPWMIVIAIILLLILLLLILLLLLLLKRKGKEKPKEKKARFKEYKEKKSKKRGKWWLWTLLLLLLILLTLGIWWLTGSEKDPVLTNETNATINETIIITNETVIINESTENITINKTIEIDYNKEAVKQALEEKKDAGTKRSAEFVVTYKNKNKVINLSELFHDPNNDPLVFSVESAENITFTINGSILTITPDTNYYGVRNTTYTATDIDGLSGSSPRITIIVKPEGSFYEENEIAIWVAIVSTLFILLILVIIIKKPKKKNKKN
jgi:Ca2+/Na+ antiporter